jgi:hypothetical protein
MKNQIIIIVVGLAIALGLQTYTMFQLNDRFNQLSLQMSLAVRPQVEMSKIPTLTPAKPGCDANFFEGHSESL